jgi:two-component system, OmpR family, phosphate regulon sensor histidine kinase PhoR
MRSPGIYEIYLALGAALLALGLMLLGQTPERAALLALAPYLLRHLFHLGRLARMIRRHHRLVPPFPNGLWGEIFRAIGQYQQRGRKGRKRQVRFTRRFREAANSVPDALIVLDKAKRIEWANPAAASLMGVQWPRDDGRRLTEVFEHTSLGDYIDAGEYGRPLEVAPEHNQSLMLSLRVAPFGERKKQRLVVGRDITKVFHLNMIRRDFVANASHELRTPLTVISGFIENLADSAQTPEQHQRPLTLMHNQTERMRSIIEDLLTLSRLEMEDHARNLTLVDIPHEAGMIVADARVLSEGAHQFSLDIDPDLLLIGNQNELRSVLSNLIFNAVRHTPPGSHVRVVWRDDERGPIFSVQDDGPGIGVEHIPRLTERFYRVDTARSRASGGTGLGLAIVKHVLSRHDAEISIASEVGAGATFTCCFAPKSRMRRAASESDVAETAASGQAAATLPHPAIQQDSLNRSGAARASAS